jgi:hypothetical protein
MPSLIEVALNQLPVKVAVIYIFRGRLRGLFLDMRQYISESHSKIGISFALFVLLKYLFRDRRSFNGGGAIFFYRKPFLKLLS